MPATSFYADAAYNTQKSRQALDPDLTADDGEFSVDDLQELEIAVQT
jgi:RNA polymerase nonessential primary-like sigma factor